MLETTGLSATAESYISLLLAVVLFVMQRVLVFLYIRKRRTDEDSLKGGDSVRRALFRRWVGVLLLGFVPILLSLTLFSRRLSEQGLVPTLGFGTWLWMGIALVTIVPAIFISSRSEGILERYPEIRENTWNRRLLLSSAVSWVVYLWAYEYFMRGFVLFACIRAWGLWTAVLINVVLYALVHVDQGLSEVLGAVPLGFFFCAMTLSTGAVWAAFFAHVVLAFANEWITLARNPEMKIV